MENTTIITGTRAKSADRYAIDILGIPSLDLMETASTKVKDYLSSNFASSSILIVCGTGNNGADGVCVGKLILEDKSFTNKPLILITGNAEHASWEFLHQLSEYKRLGGEYHFIGSGYPLPDAQVLVDAVFGIGLQTELRKDKAELLNAINHRKYGHVVAVDVPSGINSDTGKLMGAGIRADTTITFGRCKTGLIQEDGKEYAGEVIVEDIGIPDEAYEHTLS